VQVVNTNHVAYFHLQSMSSDDGNAGNQQENNDNAIPTQQSQGTKHWH